MDDIKNQPFWDKLNPDIKTIAIKILDKKTIIKCCNYIQILGALILFFFTNNYKDVLINGFNSNSLCISIIIVGIFWAVLEKIMKVSENSMKELIKTVKNKMIIKICTCHNYCECKEEFNSYMKKIGIKIID